MAIGLSKSRYCKGLQCPKILWMDKYMPDKAEDVLSETVMANGNLVGDLARSYFGDYSLVEFDYDKENMVRKTKELIDKGVRNIAEAAFLVDGLYCAVDILRCEGDAYSIVEVKSSTHVSDIYIDDMAFQYYVLTRCGLNITKVYNMHLDSSYVRNGDLELKKLFSLEDYTEEVIAHSAEVEDNVEAIRKYIDRDIEPERDIDLYCENPYACAYYGYCSRHLPEESIFDVRRLFASRKYEYYHRGIISFEDIIKNDLPLSEKQMKQVEASYYNKPDIIHQDSIREFLRTLSFPV